MPSTIETTPHNSPAQTGPGCLSQSGLGLLSGSRLTPHVDWQFFAVDEAGRARMKTSQIMSWRCWLALLKQVRPR
jgi:hypothetical protein